MTPIEIFKTLSVPDRLALNELREYAKERVKREVSISEMIRAVTPGLDTPEFLRNC